MNEIMGLFPDFVEVTEEIRVEARTEGVTLTLIYQDDGGARFTVRVPIG